MTMTTRDTYASRHQMTRSELTRLIRNTEGEKPLHWYAEKSGYSTSRVSKLRADLGLHKLNNQGVADSAEFKAMLAFAEEIMNEAEGVTSAERVAAAVAIVRNAYPDNTIYQMNLIRRHLRGLSAQKSKLMIDAHSGFIHALRVPLNQIAEVVR